MIGRAAQLAALTRRLARGGPLLLVAPRESGGSTLSRQAAALFRGSSRAVDLGDPRVREQFDPAEWSEPELVVADGCESAPDRAAALLATRGLRATLLVSALLPRPGRPLADTPRCESGGFTLEEVGATRWDALWLRGGLPLSFLAATDLDSATWRRAYLRRALDDLVLTARRPIDPDPLRRLWMMVARTHGQLWNASELARSLGTSAPTTERWRAQLVEAGLLSELPAVRFPLHQRQRGGPRVYVRDSGVLHALLSIGGAEDLRQHPVRGASWEWFGQQQVAAALALRPGERSHWGSYTGARVDLVAERDRQRLGFRFQLGGSTLPRGLEQLPALLDLIRIDLIVPGATVEQLAPQVRLVGIERVERVRDGFPAAE